MGRPFVGSAGRYLGKVPGKAGLDRPACFITDIVKCRPSKNRKPKALEWNTCGSTYLLEQLEAVQPKVIVLMGTTAAGLLSGFSSIEASRGRTFKHEHSSTMGSGTWLRIIRPPASIERTWARRLKRVLAQL